MSFAIKSIASCKVCRFVDNRVGWAGRLAASVHVEPMSLRRKILFKDGVLLLGLMALLAGALWGFTRQREHVQASLNEYAALQHVEVAQARLVAFRDAVHADDQQRAIQSLRAALLAMSEYKALVGQYNNTLPVEITEDLQALVKDKTRRLVTGFVQLIMQVDPPSAKDRPRQGARIDTPAVLASVENLSRGLADLLIVCNGFVHRTQLQSDLDLRRAVIAVSSIAAGILLVALAASYWQYRRVVVPLQRLRAWCRLTASGDFSIPYRPTADREFQDLGRDVNKMADELSAFYKKLEEMVAAKSRELVRSERLASVGYLAAGVAHEINNPLNIMSGYAELSLKRLKRSAVEAADADLAKHLAIIRSEAFRCKEITQKLLSLARGSSDVREVLSLSDAVLEVATMVRGLKVFRGKRLLTEGDDADPLYVRANLTEIKQVLLNLIINAVEAAEEGAGRVVIERRRVQAVAELTISDNGRGMSEKTIERIFEPFFTNKRGAGDPGTGLGLSITRAIVTHHGGEIVAESDGPGLGSRFIVRFPLVEPISAPATTRRTDAVPEAVL